MTDFYFDLSNEREICSRFLERGCHIQDVEDVQALADIRNLVIDAACTHLGVDKPSDPELFLNTVHELVPITELNSFRLSVIRAVNEAPWFRAAYYNLARQALSTLVGNELAMQRSTGLSIQMPNDDSSLLPLHADVWDGDSPYEVVMWLPLVHCYDTKTMYILPPEQDAVAKAKMSTFRDKSVEDFYQSVESDLEWVDIRYGQVMIFSQNMIHGNRLNIEAETRWSFNCRFKSLLSPYGPMKPLGESFEPIFIRPTTRFGMTYSHPEGFDE